MTVAGAREALPLPTLEESARAAETASEWGAPARVIGLALNTLDLDEKTALEACREGSARLGVPATDPVRFGAAVLAEAVTRSRSRPAEH